MLPRMQPDGAPSPPDAAPPARPVFSVRSTILYAVLWSALTLWGWRDYLFEQRASELYWPVDAAACVVEHDVYLADALDAVAPWQRDVLGFFEGSPDSLREGALEVARDGVDLAADGGSTEERQTARGLLAVLLAEQGSLDDALDTARGWPALEGALRAAYGAGDQAPADGVEDTDLGALDGWPLYQLDARMGRRAGDSREADDAERALAAGRARSLFESRLLAGAEIGLVGVGLALLGIWSALGRIPAAPPERRGAPPWSLATGLGVLVRGDFWSRLYYVSLDWPSPLAATALADPLLRVGTLVGSLPLVYLVWRHLLRPRVRPDPLGLRSRIPGPLALVGFALVLAAIDQVLTQAVGWSTWFAGTSWDWAESFDETLVFDPVFKAALGGLDLVVLAPIVEELAFRGVLFLSLRRRLGPWSAAALSALVFAGLHFYSLPGMLSTFVSGMVWALGFERVRSLWPGILAHGVYNALYVAGVLLSYR